MTTKESHRKARIRQRHRHMCPWNCAIISLSFLFFKKWKVPTSELGPKALKLPPACVFGAKPRQLNAPKALLVNLVADGTEIASNGTLVICRWRRGPLRWHYKLFENGFEVPCMRASSPQCQPRPNAWIQGRHLLHCISDGTKLTHRRGSPRMRLTPHLQVTRMKLRPRADFRAKPPKPLPSSHPHEASPQGRL
ncbi:hypothetical protein COCNU_contig69396295G000010 [Cocos nucifera]|nr:hypothetical protein [Cocos nucifera]